MCKQLSLSVFFFVVVVVYVHIHLVITYESYFISLKIIIQEHAFCHISVIQKVTLPRHTVSFLISK